MNAYIDLSDTRDIFFVPFASSFIYVLALGLGIPAFAAGAIWLLRDAVTSGRSLHLPRKLWLLILQAYPVLVVMGAIIVSFLALSGYCPPRFCIPFARSFARVLALTLGISTLIALASWFLFHVITWWSSILARRKPRRFIRQAWPVLLIVAAAVMVLVTARILCPDRVFVPFARSFVHTCSVSLGIGVFGAAVTVLFRLMTSQRCLDLLRMVWGFTVQISPLFSLIAALFGMFGFPTAHTCISFARSFIRVLAVTLAIGSPAIVVAMCVRGGKHRKVE